MAHLTGKTALVTYGSSGVGRATALVLARDGAEVVVHHWPGEKEADVVVAEVHAAGGKAINMNIDLREIRGPHALARHVRAIVGERLDILVTNAEIRYPAGYEDATLSNFDALFAMHVRTPYFLVQQLLPVLGQGSSVVLLSYLTAHATVSLPPVYAATIGAVHMLVKDFASTLGERGIRVNAIAPSVVTNDQWSPMQAGTGRGTTPAMQAPPNLLRPDEIAGAVAFFASDKARCVTGDILQVDGYSKR